MQTTTTTACVICWTLERDYFLKFGTDHYTRNGDFIPESELYWNGRPQYRSTREFCADSLDDAKSYLAARYIDCGYVMIFLADNEWGNEIMSRVAAEHFAAHPDCQFIDVYEHAGWHLGFRRDLSIWTTANDMARLSKPLPQPAKGCIGTIRR